MKTTACILLLAAAAWAQEVAVPQGGSLGPSCKLSDGATLGADKLDGSHSSATPAANTVPVTGSNGKLAPGWIPLPTGSSIGGVFMSADCLAGNHVSGIDAATGQLKCAGDAADWSNIGNKPAAFPPDTGSQSWQDLLAALALKAAAGNAALTGTTTAEEIVAATSVQVGSGTPAVNFSYGTATPTGACTAGMYWQQVSADTAAEFYCSGGSWTASGAGGGGTWGSISGTLSSQADLQAALNGALPKSGGTMTGPLALAGNPSGTNDAANKGYVDTQIGTRAPVASPTFTGTVSGITATMVGLGNVTNVAQMPSSYLDTDAALAADSDTKVASQKAVKAYVDGKGVGESTPALDETTTPGAVYSSKPLDIAGTQTDTKVIEGTPVVVAGEYHFSFNSTTHRPAYSVDGGAASDLAYVGDAVTAAQLPKPTTAALGGVYSDADCASGQHFNGIDTSTGKLKCSADTGNYTLPALAANTLGGIKGTGSALLCSGTDKVKGFASDGTMQCEADQAGSGETGWITAPVTTHDNDTGTYNNDVTVTIAGCTGNNAYYSADGTTVTKVSDSPSNTVSITATGTTLKSRCQPTGYTPSAVKSSTYTLTVATPTASPDGGTYSSTQSVTLASATSGAAIKYCQDVPGTCDPSAGTTYSTAVSVSSTGHLRAIATKSNYATSAVKDAAYTIGAGGSTPVVVQKKGCASNGNLTSYSCATTGTIGAVGNLVVVTEAVVGGSAVSLTAPTANCVTGDLIAIGTQFDGTDRQESLHAWYGYTTSSGSTCTATATNTHTGTITEHFLSVYEISGANATSPIDGTPCTGKTSGGAATSSPQCSSAITLGGNDLALAFSSATSTYNWTVASPLTLDYGFLAASTNTTGLATYGVTASGAATSSIQPAMTTSSNSYWLIKGFAIKP